MKLLRSVPGWLALGLLMVPAFTAAAATARPPNIVVLLADDLGYGDVHALNPQRGKIATPNYDRLVREGMTFTDAHGGSSVCTPTRYGLLTGRYAWRTRLQHGVLDGYVPPLIAADRLTLPAMLQQRGYGTACVGKWHLGYTIVGADKTGGGRRTGPVDKSGTQLGLFPGAALGARTPDGPLTRGFDEYFGFHHARMMESMFDGDRVAELIPAIETLPRLVQRARQTIARRAGEGRPFLLYFALSSPHTPILPSKEWQGKSPLGPYGDFVMETDWAIGEVLAALEQAGLANDTLVIATSDNGCSPAAGTEKLEAAGHFASAQFRGYKADIWDGGHRIPFIVRWPQRVRGGSRCDTTICLTDLFATCAEITGTKIPAETAEDSFSFLPDLLGTGRSARESIVHHSIDGRFAIRAGAWKLELCPGSGGWAAPRDPEAKAKGLPAEQLYDLANDIGEERNLQAERPEIVQRLKAEMRTIVERGRSTPGPPRPNDVPIDFYARHPKSGG
jgi:arylsulfatase A